MTRATNSMSVGSLLLELGNALSRWVGAQGVREVRPFGAFFLHIILLAFIIRMHTCLRRNYAS